MLNYKMFFLRNKVMNMMLKNKRTFSNYNNGCNLDNETTRKLQMMFIMTPSLYILNFCNFALTVALIFK